MTEKVKLPKEVCDALDLEHKNWSNFEIILRTINNKWVLPKHRALNSADSDMLMRALVLGYEPELSTEEQLKDLYEHPPEFRQDAYRKGIRDALRIHGISYDWMEGLE